MRFCSGDKQARQVCEREDPEQPDRHHSDRDQGTVEEQRARRIAVDPVEDARQLQPDEDEQRRVEQELDDLPDRVALDPGGWRRQHRRQAAHVDADGHGGEHAGDADRLRRQIGEVAAEQGDRHLDRRGVDAPPGERDDGADDDADRDAAENDDDELTARLEEAEGPGDDSGDGELVGDERGAVIDQRLAFDDRDDPPRDPEAAGDGRGRDGVGRRDDRPEHERRRPIEAERVVGDDRNPDHRRKHEADRERRDLTDVAAQLAERREVRRRVEQRRQDHDQDEIRVERDVGDRR